jgi:hypothetical protein
MSGFKSLKTDLPSFWRGEQGSTFTLVAIGLLGIVGFAALAIDLGNAYVMRSSLQNTADAAALAAATELPDKSKVQTRAREYATKNMSPDYYGEVVTNEHVVVGNWDDNSRTFSPDGSPTNAVQVMARMSDDTGNAAPTFFARLFGQDGINVSASAIAAGGSNRCIYVLDDGDRGALKVSGTAQIETDCGIAVNSNDDWGIQQIGADSCMNAPSIEVVGGYTINCTSNEPVTGIQPLTDPLTNLLPPAYAACDYSSSQNISSATDLSPGVYCADVSVQSGANVTLDPGTYVFDGAGLNIGAGSSVQGEGVTIFFAEGGKPNDSVTVAGGASVTLSAPDSGPYDQVLFYADRNAHTGATHRFTGGSSMDLTGILYAPNQHIDFSGGADLTGSCVTIISRNLEFSGNANISASSACPNGLAPLGTNLRLVN